MFPCICVQSWRPFGVCTCAPATSVFPIKCLKEVPRLLVPGTPVHRDSITITSCAKTVWLNPFVSCYYYVLPSVNHFLYSYQGRYLIQEVKSRNPYQGNQEARWMLSKYMYLYITCIELYVHESCFPLSVLFISLHSSQFLKVFFILLPSGSCSLSHSAALSWNVLNWN